MENKKPGVAGAITAKLDMSLDDLIASASTKSTRDGKFAGRDLFIRDRRTRGRRGGGRNGRGAAAALLPSDSRMEIDQRGYGREKQQLRDAWKTFNRYSSRGFGRNRQSDLIQTKVPFKGNWRGNRSSRFEYSGARWNAAAPPRSRRGPSLRALNRSPLDDDDDDDITPMEIDEGAMSDGEIATTPAARRQLILDSRWIPDSGLSRRRRNDGRMIRISGLDYSILKSDLEELFQSIGPIERCWIDYDKTDRSLGTGGVVYKNIQLARAAVQEFDRRTIDGQELRLELVGSENYF